MVTFLKGWLYAGTAALVLLSAHAGLPVLGTSLSAGFGAPAHNSTVNAQSLWELPLRAGMNLVSLPRSPASNDLNHLFGSALEVDLTVLWGQDRILPKMDGGARNEGTEQNCG